MTTTIETVVNPMDTPVDSMLRASATVEENRTLRHVMASLGQWPRIKNVSISDPFFPSGYGPFDNCGVVPSTTRPQGVPFRNNPTVTKVAPVYTLPQPTVTQRTV
ncbi:hypothetical protein KY285_035634 [Solanum tuberosum]|nr:hypothetical protein KY289_035866 [Solanum tuberosum]KAH0639048.1 hypothetical protein KY285_035634 [Solanum tuberosum]